jgi:hypothetical protein
MNSGGLSLRGMGMASQELLASTTKDSVPGLLMDSLILWEKMEAQSQYS